MLDDEFKNKMLSFLERNYSVRRVKFDLRFKRAILLDDGVYYVLSDYLQVFSLKNKFNEILYTVFNSDEESNKFVITKFLNK